MKKALLFLSLTVVFLMCLVACNGQTDHIHKFGDWSVTKNPTCIEGGVKTRYCDCGAKQSDTIPANGHKVETIPAKQATCTTTGLTDGKRCFVCSKILFTQQETPIKDHIEVTDEALSATCLTDGKTEGKHCLVCNKTLVEQMIVPAEHKYDDMKCTLCGVYRPDYGTEGLRYTLSEDGDYYIASWKGGTCFEEKLVIPSVYNNLPVKEIAANAFENCSNIISVIIPDSIIFIDEYAFSGCTSMTDLTIGKGVTSVGYDAFDSCSSLTNVYINDLANWCGISFAMDNNFLHVTSCPVVYAENIFLNGELITDLIIPDTVTEIVDFAFAKCTSLTSVTIPDSVTSIGNYVFYGGTSITSVTIPDSVTNIGIFAFTDCTSLGSIIIPYGVTNIGYGAFAGCTSLTTIVVPDSLTSIGARVFSECVSIKYNEYDNGLYLGNENNPYHVLIKSKQENITNCKIHEDTKIISSAFEKCSSLTSITIPDSVNSIGEYAFFACSSLTNITIPDSVTSIGSSAFSGCESLTSVTVPDSVTSIGEAAFYNCTSLKYNEYDNGLYLGNENNPYHVLIKSKQENITNCKIHEDTKIISSAFENCSSLTSITIPDSVTSIGVCAFIYCRSLTNINFEGTVEQWNAISLGTSWNDYVPATYVQCSDGTVRIK